MCYMNTILKNRKSKCSATKNPDYAVIDENTGKPIVAYVRMDEHDPVADGGGN